MSFCIGLFRIVPDSARPGWMASCILASRISPTQLHDSDVPLGLVSLYLVPSAQHSRSLVSKVVKGMALAEPETSNIRYLGKAGCNGYVSLLSTALQRGRRALSHPKLECRSCLGSM